MESIAARAGIAKTTLYRRWSNSADLALAAMRSFEEVVDDPPAGPVRDQLLWLLEGMWRKWSNPRYAAMMRRVAADGSSQPETYRRARERLIGPHIEVMNAVIARGVDEGTIRADADIEWVRQMLVSPIMASVLTLKDRVTRAQLALTVDTVLGGLGPRAE